MHTEVIVCRAPWSWRSASGTSSSRRRRSRFRTWVAASAKCSTSRAAQQLQDTKFPLLAECEGSRGPREGRAGAVHGEPVQPRGPGFPPVALQRRHVRTRRLRPSRRLPPLRHEENWELGGGHPARAPNRALGRQGRPEESAERDEGGREWPAVEQRRELARPGTNDSSPLLAAAHLRQSGGVLDPRRGRQPRPLPGVRVRFAGKRRVIRASRVRALTARGCLQCPA